MERKPEIEIEPMVQNGSEPESVTEPAEEPITEHVTEPAEEPITEPVTELAEEPITEPVTESVMIEIENVTMRFKMNNDRILSLKEFVTKALRRKLQYNEFQALQDVSFIVRRGETLGLIGRNGAGKSTLLKVISGILKPTTGKVTVHGNVVPMLELGSGFDFDLTGKENIFLNGAILGYSEEFLHAKYEEIVAFSELGPFIDMPIRNYSSGMLARLAFSIAAMVQPEILIVDEILSVGDAEFQEKSRARMTELMGGGTTVLFVSHSISQIREMCNRVIWLEQGKVKMEGTAKDVCDAYELS